MGVADADGGGDGFGVIDHRVAQEGGGAGGLVAEHFRAAVGDGGAGVFALAAAVGAGGGGLAGVFAVADPVGGDVAGVADGQAVVVGGAAQGFDDFEGGGLLALQAVGVDGVDDGDRGVVGDFLDQAHAVVEVALDLDDDGAVHHGLGEFAHGDFTVGDEDEGGDAGAGGVGGGGGGGVAGGGADDGLGARFDGLGDGHAHAAVFEGAGGIEAFIFDVEVNIVAEAGGDVVELNEGSVAFAQGEDAGFVVDGEAVAIAFDQAGVVGVHGVVFCSEWELWGEGRKAISQKLHSILRVFSSVRCVAVLFT